MCLILRNKYDYSHVVYVGAMDKVKIICPLHGEFEQRACNHYNRGSGCKECSLMKVKNKIMKWTYDRCYEEAKKYKTRSEYKKGSASAYSSSCRKSWLNYYFWFEKKQKPNGYWTYENCYKEAKKYKTRSDFNKGSKGAYNVSLKNDWLDNYTWFKQKQKPAYYWTLERSIEEAKKYNSRSMFEKSCYSAYKCIKKHRLLDKFFINKRDEEIKIHCVYQYNFKEHNAVYIGRTLIDRLKDREYEHKYKDNSSINRFITNNKIEKYEIEVLFNNLTCKESLKIEDELVKKRKEEGYIVLNKAKTGVNSGSIGALGFGKWTYENCLKEAKKYKSRSEFEKFCSSGYKVSLKKGWLDEYTWLKRIHKPNGYWTYEKCYEEAKKYKTKKDLYKGNVFLYKLSCKNDWLNDYTWLNLKYKPKGYWSYENCFNEAKKYKSRSEFKKSCGGAYNVSRKNGWLSKFFQN